MIQELLRKVNTCKNYAGKFLTGIFVFFLILGSFLSSVTEAAVNQQINYQGKLTDASSVSVADGTYNIKFRLYVDSSTTTPLWTELRESSNRVQVTSGLFSVMLGEVTDFTGVDFNQTLYLGVTIGGTGASPSYDPEMTPRKKLGVVPAAIQAVYLGSASSTQYLRNDQPGVLSTTTSSTLLTLNQTGTGKLFGVQKSGTELFTILNNGNVGIGTTTPISTFALTGTGGTNPFTIASSTGAQLFNILQNGNIGIGSSTPGSLFSVAGDISFTGALRVSGNAGTNGMVLQTTGTGAQWVATSTLGITGGSGTSAFTAGNGLIYNATSTDLVGIGTSTPYTTLTIQGKGGTNPFTIASSTGAQLFTILQNGNVGIGTSNPAFSLQATTSTYASYTTLDGTSALAAYLFQHSQTDPAFASPDRGFVVQATVDLASNPGSSKNFLGAHFSAGDPSSNSSSLTNLLIRGTNNLAVHGGSGVLGQAQGTVSGVTNSNAGTITSASALQSEFTNSSASGTISNLYGLRVNNLTNAGTITNTYGVYVGDITTGTQTNTPYSFYASDANSYNYFAGQTNIGSGDSIGFYISSRPAQNLAVKIGTSASPDQIPNPSLKVERTLSITDAIQTANGITGDAAEAYSAIVGTTKGVSGTEIQPVGVAGFASNDSASNPVGGGSNDAAGIYGTGRITGSGTGVGIGAYFAGRRDNDVGKYTGMEVQAANYGTVDTTYNSTGYGSSGIWLNANGNANTGGGIIISNPFGRQFSVGLAFTAQVTGGLTGGVASTTIRDDSTSERSLLINGTHSIAAIAVAPGAGSVGIGTTTPSARLDIYGTAGTSDIFALSSSSSARLLTFTSSGRFGIGTSTPISTFALTGTGGTNPFTIASSTGAQLLTVLQNGSVGVGTTTPGALFAIAGQSGSTGQIFDVASSSGATYFHVMAGGNIGIGTSTPSEKLTVAGNILLGAQASTTPMWTTRSTGIGNIRSGDTGGIGSTTVMAVFNGSMYVGTASSSGAAEIYRFDGGTSNWTKVSQATAGTIASGGTSAITSIASMAVYNGELYIGTGKTGAAEVYKYAGGTTWNLISSSTAGAIGGTATTTAIDAVSSMTVNGGALYVGTQKTGGAEVYRYDVGTGIASRWTKVSHLTNAGTLGTATAMDKISAMISFQNTLYVAANKVNAAGLFRYDGPGASPGNGFTLLNTAGTFTGQSVAITSVDFITNMTVFNGRLYLGISDGAGTARVVKWDSNPATATGATNVFAVVSSSTAGIIAEDVGITTGIDYIGAMAVYKGNLYVGTVDTSNIAEVYQLDTGNNWTRVSSATAGVISGASTAITGVYVMNVFGDNLWIGTGKANGAEVYSYNFTGAESYNLKFDASSGLSGGELNGNLNVGTIQFFGDNNAYSNTGNVNTGVFRLSHGINTAFGAYDLAEDYPTRDDTLQAGDVISIDVHEHGLVSKSSGTNDKNVIGIFSEHPALRLSQKDATIDGATAIPVALAGRVPVKVTLENGPIAIGDYLMTSTEPGKAAKANHPGRVIGRALSAYSGSLGESPIVTVFIGMETITSNDLSNTASTTAEIASSTISEVLAGDDLMSQVMDVANTSIADISLAVTTKLENMTLLVANKITALVLNVKQAFIQTLAILPGGNIFLPAGQNQVAGVGLVATGTTEVFISNTQIDQNSSVFLTPTTATEVPLFVAEKRAGQGFLVRIVHPTPTSITFDWFFVKTYHSKDNTDNQISTIVSSTNSILTDGNSTSTSNATNTTTSTTVSIDETHVSSEGTTTTAGAHGAGDPTATSSGSIDSPTPSAPSTADTGAGTVPSEPVVTPAPAPDATPAPSEPPVPVSSDSSTN